MPSAAESRLQLQVVATAIVVAFLFLWTLWLVQMHARGAAAHTHLKEMYDMTHKWALARNEFTQDQIRACDRVYATIIQNSPHCIEHKRVPAVRDDKELQLLKQQCEQVHPRLYPMYFMIRHFFVCLHPVENTPQ